MTEKQTQEILIQSKIPDGERIIAAAKQYLTSDEFNELADYFLNGRAVPLSLITAQKFFELFLNGCDVNEIHRLNPSFPKGAIQYARLKFKWDDMYHDAVMTMNNRVMNKINKAAVEATSIYTDMIAVANKQHGDSLKKYLQTGDTSHLADAITIRSINDLAKVIESLQKLTGQDREFIVREAPPKIEPAQSKALPAAETSSTQQILNIIAEEKRKKARGE